MSTQRNYRLLLAAAVATGLTAATALAQIHTETKTTSGTASSEVKVEQGEVVYANGKDLIIKMSDGELRYLENVPTSARATVDGKEIGIADVKVGMKLQKTITTTTIPQTITTVETVSGTVVNVMAPQRVSLRMGNGEVKGFKIPSGQKFEVDGQMIDAFGLREGMKVNVTKVVTEPATSVSQGARVAGTMPATGTVLVEEKGAEQVATKLPKTASPLPLVGLLGALSLASGAILRLRRS